MTDRIYWRIDLQMLSFLIFVRIHELNKKHASNCISWKNQKDKHCCCTLQHDYLYFNWLIQAIFQSFKIHDKNILLPQVHFITAPFSLFLTNWSKNNECLLMQVTNHFLHWIFQKGNLLYFETIFPGDCTIRMEHLPWAVGDSPLNKGKE